MEQINLTFDASEFDAFKGTHDYFSHASRTVKDQGERVIKQCVQAMDLDYSPSQWSQKVNRSNNTSVNLDDADAYTLKYGDVRWIHYAIWKHIICADRVDEIEALERQLAAAKARRQVS